MVCRLVMYFTYLGLLFTCVCELLVGLLCVFGLCFLLRLFSVLIALLLVVWFWCYFTYFVFTEFVCLIKVIVCFLLGCVRFVFGEFFEWLLYCDWSDLCVWIFGCFRWFAGIMFGCWSFGGYFVCGFRIVANDLGLLGRIVVGFYCLVCLVCGVFTRLWVAWLWVFYLMVFVDYWLWV